MDTAVTFSQNKNPSPPGAAERQADVRRRKAEAADVLAETLLGMWLAEGSPQRGVQGTKAEGGTRG